MKYVLLTVSLLVSMVCVKAQPYLSCGTSEMNEKLLQTDPDYAFRRVIIENAAKIYLANKPRQNEKSSGSVLYIIPVVFHIIHNYGPENISRQQVLDGVRLINESFQKMSADTADVIAAFKPIFADCETEFRLARIDPNGNCTDGITHTQSVLTFSASDNVKNLVHWPSDVYLNIWVVNTIASGAAGYAYYPGANPAIDGIVIRHDYMASIGTAPGTTYNSRTLTHEIGHYLDLPHVWGSSNTPGLASNCNTDDGIQDTPNTIGISNFSCNLAQISCGSLDNVQNYMDYGSCPKMFTEGQKDRMQFTLNWQRLNLVDPSNLITTGTDGSFSCTPTPVADFSDQVRFICSGDQVQLKDASWKGEPTSWNWSFPGGSPSVSTDPDPQITYNVPGVYDVSLTVTNASGSNTLTRTGLIVVAPVVADYALPYSEDFENIPLPVFYAQWAINNTSGTSQWELTNQAGSSGSQSVYINNFSGNPSSQTDEFITPSYDFSNVTNGMLTFKLAFAQKSANSVDSLKIFVSKDCGNSWSLRYMKKGTDLVTHSAATMQPFFPQGANDWRQETVNLSSSSFSHQPNIRLKFHYYQNQGNNIFIDDINLNGVLGVSNDFSNSINLNVFPNPTSTNFFVEFTLKKPAKISIDLLDITGKQILTREEAGLDAGVQRVNMDTRVCNGIYFVRLRTGDGIIYKKVVISTKE
ncbi:MAG: T9SS type A sorting domain-containing protein [Bacteroidia bacterium]|nr:T9SS type A sorting domain-containing protein [Bacteroidia bacterium]MCZ2278123.1 T9SS type A sorting domain-containing protein [Bacteroidia bacterium]